MNTWNDQIDATKAALLAEAAKLETFKNLPPDTGGPARNPAADCLHPELRFDSGDYLIVCSICNHRWVMVSQGREQGVDKTGQMVGGDPSIANKGAAAGLSGHRRVEIKA